MAGCCENKSCTLAAMRADHGRVLKIVLAVNALMFLVETLAGIAVIYTQSRWPDIVVGGIIAVLFLKSAVSVLRQSLASLNTQPH